MSSQDFVTIAKAYRAIKAARGHSNANVGAAADDVWREINFDESDVDTAITFIQSGTESQAITAVQLLGEFVKQSSFSRTKST